MCHVWSERGPPRLVPLGTHQEPAPVLRPHSKIGISDQETGQPGQPGSLQTLELLLTVTLGEAARETGCSSEKNCSHRKSRVGPTALATYNSDWHQLRQEGGH